ncbi:PPE domain-containing protein [Mycobacterium sp. 663a-19]|uniref:PPE domain-containing protein n=1 Tax=Mycobacterium sp. 663a-19 TaxID=2986148 RepID=UPI002D1F5461|nr:PPE domain-containing protein [Mycobacterium sp. 663a-19]MEB3980833.1 PPE domain-containing protein [Mycobacterium sp. 663a-19]
MADPRFSGPPETVALIFEAGSPASVIANNAVWVAETANKELAAGLSTVNAMATAANWQGAGAVASLVANTGLNVGLHTLVGWTAHKIGVTQAAVEAFTIARSSVIPSVMSIRNRVETQALYDTNFMGINGPNIVAHESEYHGDHWPHNASVGWAYSAALSALTAALAVPPPFAPMGASPAAPAAAGEAVAQAAAQSGMNNAVQASGQATQAAGQAGSAPADAGGQLSSMFGQPMQMVSGMTQPLQDALKAPMDAFQSVGSMPQGFLSSMTGMFSAAGAPNASAGALAEPVLAGGGAAGGAGAAGVGGGVGAGGFPGAALTSYTRPTSSFEPEAGGRPTSLRAGVLNAADVRGPTTSTGMGGTPMPMSPAGMLARGTGPESDKDAVTRARVVVGGDRTDPQDA